MHDWGSGVRGWWAAIALVGSTGCLQIFGLHDRSDAPVDGGAGSDANVVDASDASSDAAAVEAGAGAVVGSCGRLPHASASCAACMDAQCCTEATNCAGDPACDEAADCLVDCSDAACRARCGVFYTHPDSLIALRACRVANCAAQCESTCGELVSANPACQACREASCCGESTTCAKNAPCGKLDLCRSNCVTSGTCAGDCNARFPDGTDDYGAWFECADTCSAQCKPGQDWSCLDRPMAWPKPNASSDIAFAVSIVDLSTEKPYVGATVKACGKLDILCMSPIDHSTTDQSGMVGLRIPAGSAGFDGYLDITGGMNASGSAIFPAIWYPEPHVVADGWRGTSQFISADDFALFGLATGTAIDPMRGHFAANAVDCGFTPAPSVSFSVQGTGSDAETKSFYFLGGVPVTTATATDQSAVGGFVNLLAGAEDGGAGGRLVVISATSGAAGGRTMGNLSFIVRPGTFTNSSFPPVP